MPLEIVSYLVALAATVALTVRTLLRVGAHAAFLVPFAEREPLERSVSEVPRELRS